MSIMSIDQSLSASGVIIWSNGLPIHVEVIKTPAKEEVVLRIRSIMQALERLINEYGVSAIVIESLPFGMNSTSVRPLAALYYFLQNLCKDLTVSFNESHVTKVKKLATGAGNAKKQDMIEALAEDSPALFAVMQAKGYKKTTGLADLADSYWIYRLYEKENYDEIK